MANLDPTPAPPSVSARISAAASPYGKLIGGGVGNAVALAIIETADQYLPMPLGPLAEAAIMIVGNMIAVYATKHNWATCQPSAP